MKMRLPNFVTQRIKPGIDRWTVKTGTDADALTVPLTPMPSTIAALIALPVPKKPTARLAMETVVYAVPCTITLWKQESDGDHHLVMQDEHGNTMIGEIPNPACITGPTPWLSQITTARTQFDIWPRLGKPSIVTGVCFMDHAHGQTGVAPNAIELHPILSIVDPAGVSDGTV